MRILVLRPQADAERTARAISARGNEPVLAPLFTIVRLPESAPAGPFQAIVLTSGNAVPTLADAPKAWRDLPVFTVGARTAGKAREAGYADSRSADGDRNDMIELIGRNLPPPAKLLLIAGQDRHEDVPQRLTEAGYDVTIWTAYAAEALAILPKEAGKALAEGELGAVLHYSARGAETFVVLTRAVGLVDEALALTHVALSADVAAPLISAGASTVLVAEFPEEAAMLAALDEVSARNRLHAVGSDAAAQEPAARDPAAASEGGMPPDDGATETSSRRKAKFDGRPRRTPPTIEARPHAAESDATKASAASAAILPTEALPKEFAAEKSSGSASPSSGPAIAATPIPTTQISGAPIPGTAIPETPIPASRDPQPDERAPDALPPEPRSRTPWPALALAGLVGGVIGAGLVMLALSHTTPAITPEQVAELRSRIEGLQRTATAIDGKASAAAAAATKAGSDAQANAARLGELASAQRAQAPDAGAIAGLSGEVQRAQAAAAAVGQRLDQTAERIGSVETLAKTAAAPSPQAMAAARIVLAERIQAAIASGKPFTGDVAALTRGGGAAEQVAALNAVATSGAPTRDALLAQFRTHRAMLARELAPVTTNWQDRLLGLASRIVTIRPVGDNGADDPATLLIRLENAIAGGNIVAAAALWRQLPEPARNASADFGAALQKRAAADAAIAKIAQDAVAALGAAG